MRRQGAGRGPAVHGTTMPRSSRPCAAPRPSLQRRAAPPAPPAPQLQDPHTAQRVHAIYKPRVYGDAGGWHRTPMEWVAYRLNLLLGLDLVPPVAYRWAGGPRVGAPGGGTGWDWVGPGWGTPGALLAGSSMPRCRGSGEGHAGCARRAAGRGTGSRQPCWGGEGADVCWLGSRRLPRRTAPLTLNLGGEEEELVFQEGAMMLWVEVGAGPRLAPPAAACPTRSLAWQRAASPSSPLPPGRPSRRADRCTCPHTHIPPPPHTHTTHASCPSRCSTARSCGSTRSASGAWTPRCCCPTRACWTCCCTTRTATTDTSCWGRTGRRGGSGAGTGRACRGRCSSTMPLPSGGPGPGLGLAGQSRGRARPGSCSRLVRARLRALRSPPAAAERRAAAGRRRGPAGAERRCCRVPARLQEGGCGEHGARERLLHRRRALRLRLHLPPPPLPRLPHCLRGGEGRGAPPPCS